ncbi:hypothetical protein ACFQ1M_14375 [Sungkyunkwania multivorans]|uniref:Prophage protein DUF1660 n=1 Tax=Sungkyunkwania multivorans TaxID=1173618 RepID=A0ABW3D1R9_9FLAO
MERASSKNSFTISGLFCSLFGHRFKVTKKVTRHIHEYECVHCKKQGTTDVSGNIATLTPQRKEINETLSMLYKKKRAVA